MATSYSTYASSAQAGQSVFRMSPSLRRLKHYPDRSCHRKLVGHDIPPVYITGVCHFDIQMGLDALCFGLSCDGPDAVRTSKSLFSLPKTVYLRFTSLPVLFVANGN